jgi:integrase
MASPAAYEGLSSPPSKPAHRVSYATAALAAGIPAKVVSERLGHATIAITMDTYSHVLPGLDGRAAATVARLILELLGNAGRDRKTHT